MQDKHPIAWSVTCAYLLVALFLAATVASAGEPNALPEAKLSTAVGPAFALGKAGERWAKLVAERSGGKIPARLFPGATLAHNDPAREFIALRDGAADLAVGSTLFWSAQVVELNVVSLPWVAPAANELAVIAEGPVAERLLAAAERAGVVPIALAVLGHRALALTGAAPRSPADFVGLKVRVAATPLLTDLFTTLGALPQGMAATDAHAAFRAGTLDAQEGTLATIAAARLDTFGVKQVLLWDAVAECAVFAANKAAWNGWTDETRSIVRDAALQAARELPALAKAENDAAQAALGRRGVTVTRLTATGRAAFTAATRGAYDKWAAVIGVDLVAATEAAVKTRP
ncbi:MAG: TRAP transporter substrate-binding protein DctP [Casimicrobiaceae bacterium]